MNKKLLRIIIPAFPSNNDQVIKHTTALGPILIASAAKLVPGWEVEVIDENNCHNPSTSLTTIDDRSHINHHLLQNERPADIIGFCSSWSSTIPRVLELANIYKDYGVLMLAGGYHARFLAKELLNNNLNLIILSNEEETIKTILQTYDRLSQSLNYAKYLLTMPRIDDFIVHDKEKFEKESNLIEQAWSRINHIAFKHDNKITVNELPLPATKCHPILPNFKLLRYANLEEYPLNWRRGCHLRCECCAIKEKAGPGSAEELLKKVSYYYERFNATKFFIVDDQFGGNLKEAKERSELFKALLLLIDYQKRIQQKLSFTVQIGLHVCQDYFLLELMRSAGIDTVHINYESPIIEELRAIRNGYYPDRMIEWTKKWRELGFSIQAMLIFDYPQKYQAQELLEELQHFNPLPENTKKIMDYVARIERDKAIKGLPSIKKRAKLIGRFFRQARVDVLHLSLAVPVPGSGLRNRLEKEKRLLPIGWHYYDGQHPLYLPLDCSPLELLEALKIANDAFKGWRRFLHYENRSQAKPDPIFLAELKKAELALKK